MNSNKLVLSLDGNKELKDYLAKKGPGDTCTLEVTGKIDEVMPDQLIISVTEADVVGEAAEPESTPEPEEEEMPGPGKGPGKGHAAAMSVFEAPMPMRMH